MSVWLSSNCAWTSSFVLSCGRLTQIMWINCWHHSFHISVPYPTSDSSSLTSSLLVKRPNACKPNSPHFLAVSCCNQCKGLFLFSSVYLIVLPSLSHIPHSDPLWGSYSKCSRTYLLPLRGASIAASQSLCRGGINLHLILRYPPVDHTHCSDHCLINYISCNQILSILCVFTCIVPRVITSLNLGLFTVNPHRTPQQMKNDVCLNQSKHFWKCN